MVIAGTQNTCLGLKALSKNRQQQQQQKAKVKRQNEHSKIPQRYLQKQIKQMIKLGGVNVLEMKKSVTKTYNIKQITSL